MWTQKATAVCHSPKDKVDRITASLEHSANKHFHTPHKIHCGRALCCSVCYCHNNLILQAGTLCRRWREVERRSEGSLTQHSASLLDQPQGHDVIVNFISHKCVLDLCQCPVEESTVRSSCHKDTTTANTHTTSLDEMDASCKTHTMSKPL